MVPVLDLETVLALEPSRTDWTFLEDLLQSVWKQQQHLLILQMAVELK